MLHEIKNIVRSAKVAKSKGIQTALASVVSLDGSSYRRPGVRMSVQSDGKMIGAVSGGCVEKEVLRQAQSVFEIVKNDLCNLTGAYNHEDMAHMTLYFLIAAVLIQVLIQSHKWPKHEKILEVALILFIFTTNFYLIQTAHTGGKLVYEQGAGVQRALKACEEI